MKFGQKFNPWGRFIRIQIPEQIVAATTISPGAKLAYGRLLRYAGKDGKCFPSVPRLAKEIGASERQTQRYLKELVELGLICRNKKFTENGDQTSNSYEFLLHPIFKGGDISVTGDVNDTTPGDINDIPRGDTSDTTPGDTSVTLKKSVFTKSVLNESGFNQNGRHSVHSENVRQAKPTKTKNPSSEENKSKDDGDFDQGIEGPQESIGEDRFRHIFLINLHEDHKNGRISSEELEQSMLNYADYQAAQKQA